MMNYCNGQEVYSLVSLAWNNDILSNYSGCDMKVYGQLNIILCFIHFYR